MKKKNATLSLQAFFVYNERLHAYQNKARSISVVIAKATIQINA